MRSLHISVTAADIVAGQPESKRFCPVALAAIRALNRDVRVSQDSLQIGVQRVKLPGVARSWISAFDTGEAGEPFQFVVRV